MPNAAAWSLLRKLPLAHTFCIYDSPVFEEMILTLHSRTFLPQRPSVNMEGLRLAMDVPRCRFWP